MQPNTAESVFLIHSPKQIKIAIVVLLLIASAIASSGNISLPLDAHETFVVQTTQEMHDRGDWIIPYFNKQPRLNKPPLNYWLTGVTAWITDSLNNIQPWHGRFVSVIAALGLVIFTLLICIKLYERKIAYYSSIMLVTSLGFFDYSHDARPDMLYSMFCVAGITAFIYAWKSSYSAKSILYSYLMWVAYALATLTKGPQIPAMFIISSLIFSRSIKLTWQQTFSLIRPVTGFILYTIIAAPWWILVNNELGGAGLQGTQLAGSLLTIKFSNLFNFYYFYRPLVLIVPWVLFMPHAIVNFSHDKKHRSANMLMALLILIPAILLSFGSQERWFYMLPSMIPMIILLATGAYLLSEQIYHNMGHRWFKLIFLSLMVVPASIIVAIFYTGNISGTFNLIMFIIVLIFLFGLLIWTINNKDKSLISQFMISGLAYTILFIVIGITNAGWSKDRFENYKLAIHAHDVIGNQPIYTVGVTPDVYVYYTSTGINIENNLTNVINKFRNSSQNNLFIITHEKFINSIPDDIKYTILHKTRAQEHKNIYLVRFEKQAS